MEARAVTQPPGHSLVEAGAAFRTTLSPELHLQSCMGKSRSYSLSRYMRTSEAQQVGLSSHLRSHSSGAKKSQALCDVQALLSAATHGLWF